jgi:pimeloyl-ACP methyl ester carboxylesterase
MQYLASRFTVIAPDYSAVKKYRQLEAGFLQMLDTEGVKDFALGGQSYGGLLAQAFLATQGNRVERLVLSSTGPGNFGLAWLPLDYAAVGLVYLLPEKKVKGMLSAGLGKVISATDAERDDWKQSGSLAQFPEQTLRLLL